MAELPNVTMVKESTGSLDQASQIINATDLTVLSGDDSLTLPLLSIGARGVVSVVGNIIPRDVIAMIRAFESGDMAEARRWHHKLFPLCRDMLGLSTNPIPIKAAMRMLGRDTGESAHAADTVKFRRRGEIADDPHRLRPADKVVGNWQSCAFGSARMEEWPRTCVALYTLPPSNP